jgi:hypothetical protein
MTKRVRHAAQNWEALNYPAFDLVELEADITGDEVKAANANIPRENTRRAGWIHRSLLS